MPAGETYDGQVRALWFDEDDVPTDPENITLAELGDATDYSGYIPPAGVAYNFANARVSGADLLTSFDSQSPGRRGATPAITFKTRLADGSQDALDKFQRGTKGMLVVFESIVEGEDPTTGDEYLWFSDCQVGQPVHQNTAENTEKRFNVDFMVGDDAGRGTLVAS